MDCSSLCRTPEVQAPSSRAHARSTRSATRASVRPTSAKKMNLRTRHHIRDAFHKLDMNGDGLLSLEELKDVLQSLPVPEGEQTFSDSILARILEDMDDNLDGAVDYSDFTNWIKYDGDGSADVLERINGSKASSEEDVCRIHEIEDDEDTVMLKALASEYDLPVNTIEETTPQYFAARTDKSCAITSSQHRDKVDRVKMVCHVCGYKSFPQWLNDKAHCLKCDAVLKTRPSCQERADAMDLPNLLSRRSSSFRMSKRPRSPKGTRTVGPERFFYDKSSYTGMHSCGGPDHVPKGSGTMAPAFWTRH